jgi:hypothetical protein
MDGMHHRRDLIPLALLLGVYVGGAIGQARIDTGNLEAATVAGAFNFGTFTENHTAYKLIAGVRAISLIGAEIAYMDLGHPGKSFSLAGVPTSADVKISAWALRAEYQRFTAAGGNPGLTSVAVTWTFL